MRRYGIVFNKKTGSCGICESYGSMILSGYADPSREMIQTICDYWNNEDRKLISQWEQLEQLDFDINPFVMGRQARCFGAGCPFKYGTEPHYLFFKGMQFQDKLYGDEHPKYSRDFEVFYKFVPFKTETIDDIITRLNRNR
jgi:hypothetical protein